MGLTIAMLYWRDYLTRGCLTAGFECILIINIKQLYLPHVNLTRGGGGANITEYFGYMLIFCS